MITPIDADAKIEELENHPLRLMFKAIKLYPRQASGLEFSVRIVSERLSELDSYPRHDTVLDEETWFRLSNYRYDCTYFPLVHSLNSVGASIGRMEDALGRVAGVYHGEMKVKVEDRIARALEVLHTLKSDLDATLPAVPMPRQPYLIRQQSLGHLAQIYGSFLADVCETRRSLASSGIDEVLFFCLVELEDKLRRMKADICRWRDNPSQKMAGKLEVLLNDAIYMTEAFKRLKLETMQACNSAGINFFD